MMRWELLHCLSCSRMWNMWVNGGTRDNLQSESRKASSLMDVFYGIVARKKERKERN